MKLSMLLVAIAAGAGVIAPAAGAAPQGAQSPLGVDRACAVVTMEATVKAAQIDPRRADDTLTPGAQCSVLLVERALQTEHLLDAQWVDGYFGTKTVVAYAAWQRSLGYSGLAANGLPGRASLTTLGRNRFDVTRVLTPGARVTRDGMAIDARTDRMLDEAERGTGRTVVLSQGSYNPGGDPTSAGTHDGGGVVDVSVDGMTVSVRTDLVRELRRVGFAAWVRTPAQGDWPCHIHAVAISDTDLSSPAQHQVGDYYLGRNGLANQAPDDGPRIPIHTWEEYRRGQ